MQLTRFEIEGLFHRFDYDIPLQGPQVRQPSLLSDEFGPSVTILHGPNGAGKTTILRMISGFLNLNFNTFRVIPFSNCALHFNTGDYIQVAPKAVKSQKPLAVSFRGHTARLHPDTPGPYTEEDSPGVDRLRSAFNEATESISFSLIDANRFLERALPDERILPARFRHDINRALHERFVVETRRLTDLGRLRGRRGNGEEGSDSLAAKVKEFVNEAQVDYRSFFAAREPDLFARIIRRLEEPESTSLDPGDLLARLSEIREGDEEDARLGLTRDHWNFDELARILENPGIGRDALAVIGAYVEVLESRHTDRALVAERLLKFESLMAEFYTGIQLRIDAKDGFHIRTDADRLLHEDQLSSGEYHLLYLMVSALTTRRRGTVIAIDEPELSMHIAWQRRLVRALIECASGAEPQFIFATHSPDLAADFRESMIRLGPVEAR